MLFIGFAMGVGREAERGTAFVLDTGLMGFSSLKFRIIQVEACTSGLSEL